jgi:hypothetical protein
MATTLPLSGGPVSIEGAVSLEVTEAGIQPWRLPLAQRPLFEPSLIERCAAPAGVRLVFASDTSTLTLEVAAPDIVGDPPWVFDLLVDGQLHQRVTPPDDAKLIRFEAIPDGQHLLELYLPSQYVPVVLRELRIDDGAQALAVENQQSRIVFYGSSITHCRHAAGPSETWPALVARRAGLHLTCLGYGGDCHLDPMVGRMIRDLPADLIGLKLGINMMSGSYNDRTFRAAAIGLIQTIRDGHADTPMAVVSPIYNAPRGQTPNPVGMTLELMRQRLHEACDLLRAQGDTNLHYVNGLELIGPDDEHLYVDGTHPSAEGYRFLAEAYSSKVIPQLGITT